MQTAGIVPLAKLISNLVKISLVLCLSSWPSFMNKMKSDSSIHLPVRFIIETTFSIKLPLQATSVSVYVCMCAYPLYRTAGYSFRVAQRVAICSAKRSSIWSFTSAL